MIIAIITTIIITIRITTIIRIITIIIQNTSIDLLTVFKLFTDINKDVFPTITLIFNF